MALLDKGIQDIGIREVIKNTNSIKKKKVNNLEYTRLMRGYFLSILDVFKLSYSNVHFGGNMFFIVKDYHYYQHKKASRSKRMKKYSALKKWRELKNNSC